MFERFEEDARRVISESQDVSTGLQHDYIGTGHLLLGMLRDEKSEATRVLHALGADLATVESRLSNHFESVAVRPNPPTLKPFSPRAKKVLDLALREALGERVMYVGSVHLLLGALRDLDNEASAVLVELGVTYETVLQEHRHPSQEILIADGSVCIKVQDDSVKVTIKADARITVGGDVIESEVFRVTAGHEHTVTVEVLE